MGMIASMLAACSGSPQKYNYAEEYQQRLPDQRRGDEAAAAAFEAFFSDFTIENIRRTLPTLYAPDAILNDTIATVRGRDNILAYFEKAFGQAEITNSQVFDVAAGNRGWYFSWTFSLRNDRLNDGEPIPTVGMSHIVFNQAGQVVYHQDFWDSGTFLYSYVPVAGRIIQAMKSE